jgi:hypothetical protein
MFRPNEADIECLTPLKENPMPNHLLTVATLLICATAGLAADKPAKSDEQSQPLPVYVFVGHNNARGWRCEMKDLPEAMSEPVPDAVEFAGKWTRLAPDPKSRRRAFGPALGFAHELRKHSDKPFGVIVRGVPFSTHADHWLPHEGKEYKALLEQVEAAGKDRPIRVAAVYAVNGQNDARNEAAAKAYKENTVKLIQALREKWKNPEMLFVSIRTHDGRWPHVQAVRKAQQSIDLPGYGWVDTDDVPRPDKHHYTPEGYLEIGRKFARKVVELRKSRREARERQAASAKADDAQATD